MATFRCTLVTPERQMLDDEVTYASIPAFDGQLGLAPGRAPMVAKLGDGALRLDFAEGGSRYFFLAGGFAQMEGNQLTLLTDEAVAAEDIVRQDAEAALKEAQARIPQDDADLAARQREVVRSRTLLQLAGRARQGV